MSDTVLINRPTGNVDRYHLPGCDHLKEDQHAEWDREEAEAWGYKGCTRCTDRERTLRGGPKPHLDSLKRASGGGPE